MEQGWLGTRTVTPPNPPKAYSWVPFDSNLGYIAIRKKNRQNVFGWKWKWQLERHLNAVSTYKYSVHPAMEDHPSVVSGNQY